MKTPNFKVFLITFKVLAASSYMIGDITEVNFRKNKEMCDKIAKDFLNFDVELILGGSWRVYYSWYVPLENRCIDISFRNATKEDVTRIYNDMHEYMHQQPDWNVASLVMSIEGTREMLLFADSWSPGRYSAVPNVVRDKQATSPLIRGVPLLSFQLALLRGYLVKLDCVVGTAALCSRPSALYRSQLEVAASTLALGDGTHACLSDTNADENFLYVIEKI